MYPCGNAKSATACYFFALLPILFLGIGSSAPVLIANAIAAIKAPVVEVHISNVHAREDFRKLSHVSAKAAGSIFGLGLKGYSLAIDFLLSK